MIGNASTRRCAAFSLTDLLVTLVVIAAMLAMHLPTDAASRRTARRMQNSTQLRGIHQGLVTYANSNKNNFPGLDNRGNILANGQDMTGNSGDGDTVEARFWILLKGEYMTPEYIVSPSETAEVDPMPWVDFDEALPAAKWNDQTKNYSYAMLGIAGKAGQAPDEQNAARGAEWKQTLNSQAIVLSDRNAGENATGKVDSIHSDERGEWRGSVLWNDNHVGFENEQYFETKYANGRLNRDVLDNLFDDKQGEDQVKGANALMVIAGDSTVHGGE